MIYAGHCYTNCSNGMGVFLLGAYSSDLVNWVKLPSPVFTMIGVDSPYWWAGNNYINNIDHQVHQVGEPAWFFSEGYYYLFLSGGLGDNEKKVIAVARSSVRTICDLSSLTVGTFWKLH